MTIHSHTGVSRTAKLVGAAGALALVATACSSGTHSGGTSNAAATTHSGATTVVAHKGSAGSFLTDSAGKTLYMFDSDTASKSTCNGACVRYWQPLTTTGAAHASGGATMTKLATLTRSDGSRQVVYAGHPLYYYRGDTAAGDTNGQGLNDFGAQWWLLSPSGSPITSSSSGSSSSSSSAPYGNGGGGGY